LTYLLANGSRTVRTNRDRTTIVGQRQHISLAFPSEAVTNIRMTGRDADAMASHSAASSNFDKSCRIEYAHSSPSTAQDLPTSEKHGAQSHSPLIRD
jgi:hypothetical protein